MSIFSIIMIAVPSAIMFGLVYLFIHSVTYVTLDMSITDYNLYITTQLIIYGHTQNTM